MSGNPPIVTLSPATVGPVLPGSTITVTATITDADDSTEMIHAVDGMGRQVAEQIVRTDPHGIVWSWDGGATIGLDVGSVTVPAPDVSGTIVAAITDGQGNEVVASCPVTVTPPMLVGVDVNTTGTVATFASELAMYPGLTGPTKLFWAPTKGLPTLTGMTAHIPTTAIPHLCFKDFPTQAQWLALLDTLPGAWREVWLTWQQEGDRALTPAAFLAGWTQLIAWAAGHPQRARIKLVPDLTWYWEHYKNADHYAEFIPAGADLLAIDAYPGGQSGWMDPADLIAGPVAAAHAAGLPLVFGEVAVIVAAVAGPAVLQARADWYARLFTVAEAAGVHALAIWSAPPTAQTGVFRLAPPDPAYKVVAGRVRG